MKYFKKYEELFEKTGSVQIGADGFHSHILNSLFGSIFSGISSVMMEKKIKKLSSDYEVYLKNIYQYYIKNERPKLKNILNKSKLIFDKSKNDEKNIQDYDIYNNINNLNNSDVKLVNSSSGLTNLNTPSNTPSVTPSNNKKASVLNPEDAEINNLFMEYDKMSPEDKFEIRGKANEPLNKLYFRLQDLMKLKKLFNEIKNTNSQIKINNLKNEINKIANGNYYFNNQQNLISDMSIIQDKMKKLKEILDFKITESVDTIADNDSPIYYDNVLEAYRQDDWTDKDQDVITSLINPHKIKEFELNKELIFSKLKEDKRKKLEKKYELSINQILKKWFYIYHTDQIASQRNNILASLKKIKHEEENKYKQELQHQKGVLIGKDLFSATELFSSKQSYINDSFTVKNAKDRTFYILEVILDDMVDFVLMKRILLSDEESKKYTNFIMLASLKVDRSNITILDEFKNKKNTILVKETFIFNKIDETSKYPIISLDLSGDKYKILNLTTTSTKIKTKICKVSDEITNDSFSKLTAKYI